MAEHDHHAHREDADYRIVQAKGGGVFTFVDKRTEHKFQFHDCTTIGYGNNIFLYYYPTTAPDDASRTMGYRCGYLEKSSIPEWLLEEFESIHDSGELTTATDPR